MFCHQCGATIPDTVKFCVKCGAPVRSTAEATPTPAPAPVPQQAAPARVRPERQRMPKRTLLLIGILALVAAFGCGMLAGFLVGSAVADKTAAAAPAWEADAVTTDRNSGGHAYAAFTVTANVDAKRLHVVIETVQNGTLLRAAKSNEDGRMFTDVTAGDPLRVKLFPEYDAFAPADGTFTAEDGTTFRKGKKVPLEELLDSGFDSNQYTFYFYDGNTCVGQCVLTIDFT